MSDMKTGMMLPGQFDSQTGTLIAGLLTTDLRVMGHLRVIAILLDRQCHIPVDHLCILAMRHDWKRCRRENTV